MRKELICCEEEASEGKKPNCSICGQEIEKMLVLEVPETITDTKFRADLLCTNCAEKYKAKPGYKLQTFVPKPAGEI